MIQKDETSPLFRVWLLGEFLVEYRSADEVWKKVDPSAWGKTYGRIVLKRLLSVKGRRLQRGALLDDLWPNAEQADKYLNDAANKLRQILYAEECGSLLKTFGPHSYSGYEVAGQSLLWVDADEVLALMSKAENIGRTSARGLVLLKEVARLFERGSYLEGEAGQWSHAKRGTFEHMQYRSHIWLAEAHAMKEVVIYV